jgi:Domain of unknown function (DUF1902)
LNSIVVKAEWDPEVSVWGATIEDVPGLEAEAASMEKLHPKVLAMIEDLIELNGFDFVSGEIPVFENQ